MHEGIHLFYDEASLRRKRGKFEEGIVFETFGSWINDVAHGIPCSQWLPIVYSTALSSVDAWGSNAECAAYADGLAYLEMIAEDIGITLPTQKVA
jgi:hypothetical protein